MIIAILLVISLVFNMILTGSTLKRTRQVYFSYSNYKDDEKAWSIKMNAVSKFDI